MSVVEDEVPVDEPEEPSEPDARATEQRRIDDEFAAAARERAKIQEQAAKLLDAAQRIEEQYRPPKAEPEDDRPPKRDDYDTNEGYLEATLKHQHKDLQRYVDSQVRAAITASRESDSQVALRAKMEESARRGEEAYPGFSGVLEKVPALPQAVLSAFQELSEPEHVAHYFGTHPEEAKKIGMMTPARAAHAVIALGERLDQGRAGKQAQPVVEFGPKPSAARSPSSGYSSDMSGDAYARARISEKLRLQKG